MPDDNVVETRETIEKVVKEIRDCANNPEKVNLSPCLSRPETRIFMARYRLHNSDIRDYLSNLRVEDYSYTSRETGKDNAYVFGPDTRDDYDVFLKVQIIKGVLVLSFHEPERKMEFPFRGRKSK